VDEVLTALVDQQAELAAILAAMDEADWSRPTRCVGWDVSDVVLHLAQTDELAIGSAEGRYEEVVYRLGAGLPPVASVDDSAAALVQRERDAPSAAIHRRWASSADALVVALGAGDLSRRVRWVMGELSARTLATTRIAETWIHTGDVADALGTGLPDTDRLRLIARLAWRTVPYAFSSAGQSLQGPVAFRLTSPDGHPWEFLPDEPAVTTISGPAAELCAVAARRVAASATSLRGVGPDADAVLTLVRTYA
jgi:uncharacterized protein (TIGR03084 family)